MRAAIAVTESDEVLVARMQSSPTIASSAREQRLLGVESLDDRLDHDRAAGKSVERVGQRDARDRGIGACRG